MRPILLGLSTSFRRFSGAFRRSTQPLVMFWTAGACVAMLSDDALTLTGSGAAQKAVIEAQSYAASQLWTQVASGSNSPAALFRSMSDPGACLTVSGGHYAPGTQIVTDGCADAADQLFLRAATGATGAGDYTYDELMPFASGDLCLTAAGGVAVGHLVRLEPCDQNQDQAWSSSDGFYGSGGAPTYFAAYPVVGGALPSPVRCSPSRT